MDETRLSPSIAEIQAKLQRQNQKPATEDPEEGNTVTTTITGDLLRRMALGNIDGVDQEENEAPLSSLKETAREKSPESPKPPEAGKDDDDDDDDLDLSSMSYAGTSYDNPKMRRFVEAKLSDLDFSELVRSGKVQQKVPVCPGLNVVYQGISARDELFITEQAYRASSSGGVTFGKIYTLMELAIGVVTINNQAFSDFGSIDKPDLEKFERRWKTISEYDTGLLEPIHCNLRWFQDRVRGLSVPKQLKNG